MNVAMMTDTFSQMNGVSIHVKRLSAELSRKGHDVTVYTGSPDGKQGYKVRSLPHVRFPLEQSYEIVSPFTAVDADVVHCHTPYLVGWRGATSQLPSVSTTHTSPVQVLAMYRANWLSSIVWPFLVSFHNHTDRVICQTRETERDFTSHGLTRPIDVISTGIDYAQLRKGNAKRFRNKYGIDGGFVFSANRLSPEKRPEWTLRACRQLKLDAVMASTGPLKDNLQKKYPEARFLGVISEQDKIDALAAATAYALPTMSETEGITVSEAMAAGTPVVCTRLPVLEEIVKERKTGLLFSSEAELKGKLSLLFRDPELGKRLSRAGVLSAKSRDIKNVASEVIKVYKLVLE